jgi:uncharacterized protein (TIGR00299 family) protein
MKILYIDPLAGVSGDMLLGALVDLGVDFHALQHGLEHLGLDEFALTRESTKRHTIGATKVNVVVKDVPHPHRHLPDLVKIINASGLSESVRTQSIAALTKLAEAEARVHRMPLEHVHLHEVGGLDCLVDVVGTVLALEMVKKTHGVEAIYCGPVSVGAGFVACAHGTMPLPAPGTLAILAGFPIRRTTFPFEMTTPTGAALVTTLARPHTMPLILTPEHIGYGAGTRDPKEVANLLRVLIAELHQQPKLESHTHEHHHEADHHHHGDHAHHDHPHDHDHEHDHEHHHHSHSHEHHHDGLEEVHHHDHGHD